MNGPANLMSPLQNFMAYAYSPQQQRPQMQAPQQFVPTQDAQIPQISQPMQSGPDNSGIIGQQLNKALGVQKNSVSPLADYLAKMMAGQ